MFFFYDLMHPPGKRLHLKIRSALTVNVDDSQTSCFYNVTKHGVSVNSLCCAP